MQSFFQQMVGWLGILLLLLVLVRSWHGHFLLKYPNFHFYIGYVAFSSASALFILSRWPELYGHYYWASQLMCIVLGLGVTWECFCQTFPEFSGIRQFAKAVLITLSGLICIRLAIGALPPTLSKMVEVERDVRAIQVGMLLCFACLVVYYGIPVGRNVLGIALGYGLFVGSNVLGLAFRSDAGQESFPWLVYLQPIEYIACELIWVMCLWTYHPGAQTELAHAGDYEASVSRLGESLTRFRSYLWDGISQ